MDYRDSIDTVISISSKHKEPVQSPSNSADDVPLKETNYPQEPQYLSKEDLEALGQDEPRWRRLRIALLIVFGVVWLALVIAVILIVVLSTKCPPRPDLAFWQSGVAYYVDVFAFKDSGQDMIGDLQGLRESISYMKETVGAGFIILAPINSGYFTNSKSLLGLVNDHTKIDPALGTISEFRQLIKRLHKTGLQLVISLDFNGISEDHVWMANTTFLKRYDDKNQWYSRYDQEPSITYGGQKYYSVDNKLIDLNLTNEGVMREVLRVIQYWLDEDVDGIMLKNCAFYVENDTISKTVPSHKWPARYPTQQVFQNGSVDVVRRIRKYIDDFSSARGKKCVLIVDPGDTGYGHPWNEAPGLKFLGSETEPAAHLVMHPEFTEKRGWKFPFVLSVTEFAIRSYNESAGTSKDSLALFTASDVYRRHSTLLPTVASIILPGTPVIYYGSELGVEWAKSNDPPKMLYPAGKLPNKFDNNETSVLSCHLPMPWDRSGKDFSLNPNVPLYFGPYLDQFGISDTVESLNADGRGRTLWALTQKLIHLRSKIESLRWGTFTLHETDPKVHTRRIEIVQRKAEGFQPVFAVFYNPDLDPDETRTGIVIDFSWICEKVWLHVAYPSNELEEDTVLESQSVFIELGTDPAFYLFQCH